MTPAHLPLRKQRQLKVFTARLARIPLGAHPALMFNPDVEGYRDYTFGGRAGPSVNFRHLTHELAHAAQFGKELFRWRATESGFVFKVPRVFVFNQYCFEPTTHQATMRELETFAHELHIRQACGYKQSPQAMARDCVQSMVFMPDWYNVPGKSKEEKMDWCTAQVLAHYHRLSADEVLAKLRAWLDATLKRLHRQKLRQPRGAEPAPEPVAVRQAAPASTKAKESPQCGSARALG